MRTHSPADSLLFLFYLEGFYCVPLFPLIRAILCALSNRILCRCVELVIQEVGILLIVRIFKDGASCLKQNVIQVQCRCFSMFSLVSFFVFCQFLQCKNTARELNTKLEGWLSKASPSFRPAKAIIAP